MKYLNKAETARGDSPRFLEIQDYRVTYPANVRWVCRRCAQCCRDIVGHRRRIRLLAAEADEISRRSGIAVEGFSAPTSNKIYCREMRKVNGECRFLHRNGCVVYTSRPLVCRFYPFEMRKEGMLLRILLTDKRCPGINQGRRLKESFFKELASTAIERLETFNA